MTVWYRASSYPPFEPNMIFSLIVACSSPSDIRQYAPTRPLKSEHSHGFCAQYATWWFILSRRTLPAVHCISPNNAANNALLPDPVAPLTRVNCSLGNEMSNGPREKRDGDSASRGAACHSNDPSSNPISSSGMGCELFSDVFRGDAHVGTSPSARKCSKRCIETYAGAHTSAIFDWFELGLGFITVKEGEELGWEGCHWLLELREQRDGGERFRHRQPLSGDHRVAKERG